MISIVEVRIYSPEETIRNRSEKNRFNASNSLNKKSDEIFNMISRPNVPLSNERKDRLLRLSNAAKHGAITITKQELSKMGQKKKKYPRYIGPERRKGVLRVNVPKLKKAA